MLTVSKSAFLEKDLMLKVWRMKLHHSSTSNPISINDYSDGFSLVISDEQAKALIADILKVLEEK